MFRLIRLTFLAGGSWTVDNSIEWWWLLQKVQLIIRLPHWIITKAAGTPPCVPSGATSSFCLCLKLTGGKPQPLWIVQPCHYFREQDQYLGWFWGETKEYVILSVILSLFITGGLLKPCFYNECMEVGGGRSSNCIFICRFVHWLSFQLKWLLYVYRSVLV